MLFVLYIFLHTNLSKTVLLHPLGSDGTLAGHQSKNAFETLDVTSLTLDEFVFRLSTIDQLKVFWRLPKYISLIQYVREMNHNNFGHFCKNRLNHSYTPREYTNTSENKGYQVYLESGDISQSTNELLLASAEYNEYRNYLAL